MPRSNRLSLSLASTAAVALASLPLGITPASAAKVSEGTTSSIGVMETSPNAQQFNLKPEGESTVFISGTGRQTPQTTNYQNFIENLNLFLREFVNTGGFYIRIFCDTYSIGCK